MKMLEIGTFKILLCTVPKISTDCCFFSNAVICLKDAEEITDSVVCNFESALFPLFYLSKYV